MGILFRHFWQTYFGLPAFTYILWPQVQTVNPANNCTGFFPGRLMLF